MATVVRYVNTDSTAGGDGTTNATSGANRAYATRSEWEADEQTDLVADGDIHALICDGSGGDDATRVSIDGWTTGASNYITVTSQAAYKLRAVSNWAKLFFIAEDYYREDGLVAEHLSTAGNTSIGDSVVHCFALGGATSDIRLDNLNILGGPRPGLYVGGGTVYANNGLVNDCSGLRGVYAAFDVSQPKLFLRGFTIINSGSTEAVGASNAAYIEAKNCYAHDNGSTNGSYSASVQTNYVTCGASDTTGSSASLDSIAFSTATFVNVTSGSEDLHLVSGSGLIDEGTDISGDTNALSTDFDGVTRSGTWEVGAYEFATGVTANNYYYRMNQ